MVDLDGREMHVSSTATSGVVGSNTRLRFTQRGNRVIARYAGGAVRRRCLAGRLHGDELVFRYLQTGESGEAHGGRSVCQVARLADGRTRIVEHVTRAVGATVIVTDNRRHFQSALRYALRVETPAEILAALKPRK